jgi:hypothetical protein
MSMININELIENKNDLIDRKTKIYDKILTKCHHRIKLVSKQNPLICYCLYIIPKIVYGIPLYNLSECIKYLFDKLTENGFQVNYTHPNLLIISWIHIKPKKRAIAPEITNNYKSINNYKPTGNLIYNQSNISALNSKTNNLLR